MKASRLTSLAPYLFEDLENRYNRAVARGRSVIDLSIGDPDLAPPPSLIENLKTSLAVPDHHRYPPQRGLPKLKASIRRYLSRRVGVEPADDQILILIGSKEGIAHLPWAVCNPGDTALLPDPGYPVYHSAVTFAGCRPAVLPLDRKSNFEPDFDAVDASTLQSSRICFLNYPNNPTSAAVRHDVFVRALDLAAKGIVVVNDAAYADVYGSGEPAPLLCGQDGALDLPVIEMFSFSKTYSITGWRLGFAVGHREVVEALAHMKANIDSNQFGAIQEAVAETLDKDGDDYAASMRLRYQRRRDTAVALLEKLGFQCFPSCATFYLWTEVPDRRKSMDYALHVLDKADVLVTPGIGFGPGGEGYFRIALTKPADEIEKAIQRLAQL